ncbi:MAG TPA: S8 family serine peptidase [Gaiellaceae bacterium]
MQSPPGRGLAKAVLEEEISVLLDGLHRRTSPLTSPLRYRLAKALGLFAVCFFALAWIGNAAAATSVVDQTLLAAAKSSPAQSERMIILSTDDVSGAIDAFNQASAVDDGYGLGTLRTELPLVGGVAVTLPAARVATLADIDGITVSPDATLQESSYDNLPNIQLWPYLSGNAHLWAGGQRSRAPRTPTVALIDSGVDTGVADVANSLLIPQVDLCNLAPNSSGDGDGHGTFVSSILAGNGSGHVGAAPNSKLISLDVINDEGVATTSDVIAAAQWIIDHRRMYNIRVVNFSLHATTPSNFVNDPLDKAVEKLWFSGVVVVTAAGNYSVDGESTAVRYSPANDPFVITVGALDNKGTLNRSDDTAAPWSTWGYTLDGFGKPEIGASGRYMIGAVPSGSALLSEFPDNVFSPGYLQLSGTSFAAPVVAGAAAQLLAVHPQMTPDQVKSALMLGSERTPAATAGSLGIGELNVGRSVHLLGSRLPNPNAALNQFLVNKPGSLPYFDGNAWTKAVTENSDWNSQSWEAKWWTSGAWESKWWTSGSWEAKWWTSGAWEAKWWTSGSWEAKWWTSVTSEDKWWTSVAWEDKWWTSVSTIDTAWEAQSQTDLLNEVKAQGDATSTAYLLTKSDYEALLRDPFLTPALFRGFDPFAIRRAAKD